MKQIILPDGTPTSQIGYGCANLMGGAGMEESRTLVKAALDAGIRHFDVAPVYGSGLAEDALGLVLGNISERVTITTKVGLARPVRGASGLRRMAKRVLKFAPGLKQRLGQRVYVGSRRTAFGVDQVEASFHESLRRLGRDRVDILLLHEPEADDLTDELIGWLERQRTEGRAGSIGVGAARAKIETLFSAYPELQVRQTDWAAGDPPLSIGKRFLSTHGAIRALGRFEAALRHDSALRDRLSAQTGLDLGDSRQLARALLDTALVNNSDGLVLIATSRAERIARLTSGPRCPLEL